MSFSFTSWLVIGFLWQTWQGQTSANQCGKGGNSHTQHHCHHGVLQQGSCGTWQKVWSRNFQHERTRGKHTRPPVLVSCCFPHLQVNGMCWTDFRTVNKMWWISFKILNYLLDWSLHKKILKILKKKKKMENNLLIVFPNVQNVKAYMPRWRNKSLLT